MGMLDNKIGTLIQYDGEAQSIAGKNVIEAFEGSDTVIFNETYLVIGAHTEALKIHAMYDLTIIGDITVQECVVNGSLTIIGEARISSLSCYNSVICQGDLYADKIYVGGDMIVESAVCDELVCDGSVAVHTTININQSAKVAKTIFACEGIMGEGRFSALNGIANEYFEFDGDIEGKIVELDTDTTLCDTVPAKTAACDSTEDAIALAGQKVSDEIRKYSELSESELIEHLRALASAENCDLKHLPVLEGLFTKLTELSYQDRIETVEDYLLVLSAQKLLPQEIYSYESVEHVGSLLLPNAKKDLEFLSFDAISLEQLARVLKMAVQFEEDLADEWDILMDKIFESIGLRYSTVSSIIERNKPKQKQVPEKPAEEVADSTPQVEPNPVKPRETKAEFLSKKLSHAGKKFGLTDVELERMATIKIRTFGDLVNATDATLIKAFGKKAFLANHLIQTRNSIMKRSEDLE